MVEKVERLEKENEMYQKKFDKYNQDLKELKALRQANHDQQGENEKLNSKLASLEQRDQNSAKEIQRLRDIEKRLYSESSDCKNKEEKIHQLIEENCELKHQIKQEQIKLAQLNNDTKERLEQLTDENAELNNNLSCAQAQLNSSLNEMKERIAEWEAVSTDTFHHICNFMCLI